MPVIVGLVLGNILSVPEYGNYVAIMLLAATVAILSAIPVDSAVIHFILKSRNQDEQNKFYSSGLFLVAMNVVFVLLILIIGKPLLLSFFKIVNVGVGGYTTVVGVTVSIVFYAYFAKLMTVRYLFREQIIILVLCTVVQFAAITYLVYSNFCSPTYFVLAVFLFYFTGIVFYERRLRKEFSYTLKVGIKQHLRPLLKFSSLIYLGALTGYLDEKIDLICINAMLGKEDVAYYSYAMLFGFILYGIGLGVSQVTFPQFCINFQKKDLKKCEQIYERTLKYLFLMISFIGLGLLYNSNIFIALVLPEEYLKMIPALEIIIPGMTFFAVFAGVGTTLTAAGKPKYGLWINAFFMLINLALNLLLIPLFGIVGAALATSSTFLARSLVSHLLNRKILGLNCRIGKMIFWYLILIILVIIGRYFHISIKEVIIFLYLFMAGWSLTDADERTWLKSFIIRRSFN